jgi:hypothetical protein
VLLSLVSDFALRIEFRSVVVRATGFLTRGVAQLGPRAPAALPLPMRARPSHVSLSLIQFSRAATSSPPPLSPRGALGFGDGDRRIWTPR